MGTAAADGLVVDRGSVELCLGHHSTFAPARREDLRPAGEGTFASTAAGASWLKMTSGRTPSWFRRRGAEP
jgi:hypothetical protein